MCIAAAKSNKDKSERLLWKNQKPEVRLAGARPDPIVAIWRKLLVSKNARVFNFAKLFIFNLW